MGIVVIEQGRPDGTDFVVREARLNPTAQANAVPQRQARVIDLGEGYCIAGLTIEPLLSFESDGTTTDLCAVMSLVGGRMSDLVPMIPVKLVVGELVRLPVADVRAKLEAALKQQEPPQ